MSIHTRSSAPKTFAKFGWKTRTFCHKKNGKSCCQTRVRQTVVVDFIFISIMCKYLFHTSISDGILSSSSDCKVIFLVFRIVILI